MDERKRNEPMTVAAGTLHSIMQERDELARENAALRDRLAAAEQTLDAATEEIAAGRAYLEIAGQELAAAEQREQQARALIHLIAIQPGARGYVQFDVGIVEQARAWLADRAEQRAAEFPTPQDFGAVGDGITDDTAAIQAAIDAANQRQEPVADAPAEQEASE